MQKIKLILMMLTLILLVSCATEKRENYKVLVPKTPSGIPVYLALKDKDNFEVEFFLNHSKANAKFLRGDVDMLLTGVTIANSFAKQDVEFDIMCSVVDNLTYIVGNEQINRVEDLRGKTLVFPFADSPMESMFIVCAETLGLKKDIDFKVKYMQFNLSIEKLKTGAELLVFLPEPFVSIATDKFDLKLGLGLEDIYQSCFPNSNSAQVILLSKGLDSTVLNEINSDIDKTIKYINGNGGKVIETIKGEYPNSEKFTLKTLERTKYNFLSGTELKKAINSFYKNIGKESQIEEHILELN